MKNSLRAALAAAAVAGFVAPSTAQEPPAQKPELTDRQAQTVDRLIDAGLEDDLAWEILESLTTEVGPRLGGSPAEARAREWGVQELKRLGFKNVRIETYEMPYWARVSESAEIVSPFPQPLAVTALGGRPLRDRRAWRRLGRGRAFSHAAGVAGRA